MTIVPTSLEVVRYVRVWSPVGAHWAHPSCGLALCLVSFGLLGACVALSSRTVGEPAEGSFARFLSIFSELFRDAGAWREIFAFLMSWAVALCVIAKCEKRLREIFVCIVFTISYNLQRWMSRLEQRWRAQRSAISIVNCRIPWIDRNLNAYCTLGISWECACFSVIFIFVVVVTLFWLLLVSSLRR